MSEVKKGEFVNFFPNGDQTGTKLPSESEFAPAIIADIATDGTLHLNVFTADFDGGSPVKQAWSVAHKKAVKGNKQYWDYAE